jgi:hypothetical protein
MYGRWSGGYGILHVKGYSLERRMLRWSFHPLVHVVGVKVGIEGFVGAAPILLPTTLEFVIALGLSGHWPISDA